MHLVLISNLQGFVLLREHVFFYSLANQEITETLPIAVWEVNFLQK